MSRIATVGRRGLAAGAAALLAGALMAASVGAASSTPTVKLGDNFFSPTKLTVTAGTTVTWTWAGSATHNVTVVKGPKKFHSPDQASGTYKQRLTRTGTYQIVCTFHPGMTMTLKVTKAPKTPPSS
jgi:plastocyanin